MQLEKNLRENIKSTILKFEFAKANEIIQQAQSKAMTNSPVWFDFEIFKAYIEFVKHSLLSKNEAFIQLGTSLENFEKLINKMKEKKYTDGLHWADYYKGLCIYSQAIAKNDDEALFKEAEEIWFNLENSIIDGSDYLLIAELYLSKSLLYERYAKKNLRPVHFDEHIVIDFAIETMLDKVQEQFFRLLLEITPVEDSELKMRLNYATARSKSLKQEKLGRMREDLTKSGNIKIDSLGTISYYFLTARKYAQELGAAYFMCAIPLQLCKIISKYIYESLSLEPPPDLDFRTKLFTEEIKECLNNCKKYNIAFIAEQAVDLLTKVRDELLKSNIKIQINI